MAKARKHRQNLGYICGGNYSLLQQRVSCPNTLHDWPLPDGYSDAHDVANARIANRWDSQRCPDCGIYGWTPGRETPSTNAVHVPAASTGEPE